MSSPDDARVRLMPEIRVDETIEDVLNGRDSAMETALALDPNNFDRTELRWFERWRRKSQAL